MMIESTPAKIGRLMKKSEMFMTTGRQWPRAAGLGGGLGVARASGPCSGSRADARATRSPVGERRTGRSDRCSCSRDRSGGDLWFHRHAGAHTLETVDDDAVARLQPGAHHAFILNRATEFHGAIDGGVVLRECEHEFLALVRANRALTNQQRRRRRPDRNPYSGEKAGDQRVVGIWKHKSEQQRTRGGIEVVVGRLDE